MNTEQTEKTYKIASSKWFSFLSKIEKINKKAKKLNLPEVSFEEVSRIHVPAVHAFEVAPDVHLAHPAYDIIVVKLFGEAPYISGWRLLGVLDHNPGFDAPFIKEVPGQVIPIKYHTADHKNCDHCKVRRFRKETFILQNVETGEIKQIGRNCVADFLPGVTPEQAAAMCSFYNQVSAVAADDEMMDDFYHSNQVRWDDLRYDIDDILTHAATSIRVDGWRPSSFERKSTAGHVKYMITGPGRCASDEAKREFRLWLEDRRPTQFDVDTAKSTIEWIKNEMRGDSSYCTNLRTIVRVGQCNWGTIPILVSAVAAYHKALGRAEEIRRRNADCLNEHVGNIKDRLTLDLTVKFINYSEGVWGTTRVVTMNDDQGRSFVWFSSCELDFAPGYKINLTGTVKKHDEYKERKQTVLTRCKYKVISSNDQKIADEQQAAV